MATAQLSWTTSIGQNVALPSFSPELWYALMFLGLDKHQAMLTLD